MKARYNDGAGRSLLLYGEPGEVLEVLRGMRLEVRRPEALLTDSSQPTEVQQPAKKVVETDWATVLWICRNVHAKMARTTPEKR